MIARAVGFALLVCAVGCGGSAFGVGESPSPLASSEYSGDASPRTSSDGGAPGDEPAPSAEHPSDEDAAIDSGTTGPDAADVAVVPAQLDAGTTVPEDARAPDADADIAPGDDGDAPDAGERDAMPPPKDAPASACDLSVCGEPTRCHTGAPLFEVLCCVPDAGAGMSASGLPAYCGCAVTTGMACVVL
jgi:hypothetical protein